MFKIVTFVPIESAFKIRQAIGDAGAGEMGNYSHASFSTKGIGRFMPKKGAHPAIGAVGKLEEVEEERIEVICEKEKTRFVISVKSRNMYQLNGSLNTRYNLGRKVYENAKYAEEKYDAVAYWMAIQFDVTNYSVYFGSLVSLRGSTGIPISKCQSGEVGTILVNRKRHYFDFDFYKNTRSRPSGMRCQPDS